MITDLMTHHALSVKQPWAAAIASGQQVHEYRNWRCPVINAPIVICSTATPSDDMDSDEYKDVANKEVNGCTICLVTVVACEENEPWETDTLPGESITVPWPNGYTYRWTLESPCPVKPVPVKGSLGMFEIPFNYVHKLEMENVDG